MALRFCEVCWIFITVCNLKSIFHKIGTGPRLRFLQSEIKSFELTKHIISRFINFWRVANRQYSSAAAVCTRLSAHYTLLNSWQNPNYFWLHCTRICALCIDWHHQTKEYWQNWVDWPFFFLSGFHKLIYYI